MSVLHPFFKVAPSLFPNFSFFETLALLILVLYFIFGALQILKILSVVRYINSKRFREKNYFVSLIVPVHATTPTLEKSLESFCNQLYPNYEVIFVIQNREDPSFAIVKRVAEGRPFVKIVEAKGHDPKKCIAKSHNLLEGIKAAKGEVYLFSDSDVIHQREWIKQMVAPLGETVDGKPISATTAVFLMEARGFVGVFSSLSTNMATVLSSFTKKRMDFPYFASGASVAVFKKIFHELKVDKVWANSFNDDLTLANTLLKAGHHVYNVRSLLTRPREEFKSFGELFTKMRRWVITIKRYFHPESRKLAFKLILANYQFPLGIDIFLIFLVFGHLDYLDTSLGFLLLIFLLSYFYVVIFRAILSILFKEKNILKYVILTPISLMVWGAVYLFLPIFCHSFTWGGIKYDIRNDRYREM